MTSAWCYAYECHIAMHILTTFILKFKRGKNICLCKHRQHIIPHFPSFKIEIDMVKSQQMSIHAGNLHTLSYSNLFCHGIRLKAKKAACKQHLAEHNKRSILLFTTTSVLMHVFHYFCANLPFVILGMIYLYKTAVKTPQSHCSNPAFLFLLFIPPYF